MTLDHDADLFDDDLDDVGDRLNTLREAAWGELRTLRTEPPQRGRESTERADESQVGGLLILWRRGESNP